MTAVLDRYGIATEIDRIQPMPTGVLLGRAETHSDAWHGLRSRGIGGSEVAAILGLSPWQSPFSLWHTKRAGWTSDPNPEQAWGSAIEGALLKWWDDAHPDHEQYGPAGATYAHRSRPWQIGNPDGVRRDVQTGELVILEAKKASSDDAWGAPGTDQVPPYYRTQGIHYADVLGIPHVEFVVTNLGRAPEFYRLDVDPEEARLIRAHAAAFWRSLRHDVPPDLDGTVATYQAVRRLHPDIDGEDVVVGGGLGHDWSAAKARAAAAEREARRYTSELLAAMGTARRALHPDGAAFARRQPARGGAVALYEIGASK